MEIFQTFCPNFDFIQKICNALRKESERMKESVREEERDGERENERENEEDKGKESEINKDRVK